MNRFNKKEMLVEAWNAIHQDNRKRTPYEEAIVTLLTIHLHEMSHALPKDIADAVVDQQVKQREQGREPQ
jgi:hypothetical protein